MDKSENDSLIKLPAKQEANINEYSNYEDLLRQMLRREKLVTKIALKVRQSLKLDEVLRTSVEEIRNLLKTDRVIIYQFTDNYNGVIVVESVSPDWMSMLGRNIQDNCFQENYAPLYRDGRVRAIEDIYLAGLAFCHVELLAQFQVRANLVIPVIRHDFLWGLLIVHHCQAPRTWEDSEIQVLKQLSVQLAIAIQQAHLYEQLQKEILAHKQDNIAQNTLSELRILLQREDISWDNLVTVLEQTLSDTSQGKITWKKN